VGCYLHSLSTLWRHHVFDKNSQIFRNIYRAAPDFFTFSFFNLVFSFSPYLRISLNSTIAEDILFINIINLRSRLSLVRQKRITSCYFFPMLLVWIIRYPASHTLPTSFAIFAASSSHFEMLDGNVARGCFQNPAWKTSIFWGYKISWWIPRTFITPMKLCCISG